MRVIPVIDLKLGQVVRGVGGRRDEYRPIKSRLAADAQPVSVGHALARCGFREIYLADLDAIGGAEPSWQVYDELSGCGLSLMIDAGLVDGARAAAISEYRPAAPPQPAIVAGLESLNEADSLTEIVGIVGCERLMFSLDLVRGRPITRVAAWRPMQPLELATLALRSGVRRFIVLDLADVGQGQGPSTLGWCRALRCLEPSIEIIAGGGVRGPADVRALAAAGCDAALVASALHDGRLDAGEYAAMR